MANNYQQATVTPCLPLTDRHKLIRMAMSHSEPDEIRTLGLEQEDLDFVLGALDEGFGDTPLSGVDWADGSTSGETYFYVPEGGNVDRLAIFLQRVLRDLPADKFPFVEIEWAETCSKMRQGEFGGGAMFITRDDIQQMTTGWWLQERRNALTDKTFPWAVANELAPHVKALLDRIIAAVEAAVPGVDVDGDDGFADDDDGEPTWRLGFSRKGRETVGLTFTVTTEIARDGEGEGVGLLLDAVKEGGEIVASWAPCNYTADVWVRPGDGALDELRRRLGVDNGGLEELADNFADAIAKALGAEEGP